MAVAFGAVTAGQGSGTAARTMTYPTVNAGDVVVCIIEWGGGNLTVPTGFTAVANLPAQAVGSNIWIGWRVGTGGGTTYTPGSSTRDVWTILTLTGADTTTPVNASGSSATSVGSGVTAPSVTTNVACLVLSVAANQVTTAGTATTWTDPAGTTRRAAVVSNLAAKTTRWLAGDIVTDTANQAAAGATTARAFAGTASGDVVATTVAFAPAAVVQSPPALLRPISDVALGGWTVTGATTAWDALDDVTADDGTTYISLPSPAAGTVSAECEVRLAPVLDPLRSDLHTVRVRRSGSTAYPGFRVRLYQGATFIAGFDANGPSSYATASYTLTAAEADSITDYTNLRLRFAIDATTVSGTAALVTQAYLDVPAVLVPGAADLSATATLTAAGTATAVAATVSGAVALSSTATLTTTAVVTAIAATALSATGTLTTAALVTVVAAAALTATGTLTTAATLTRPGAAALSATATLTSAALVTRLGAVALSAAATLTVAATLIRPGAAALTAVATLTTTATVLGDTSAALSATGTLTTAGLVTALATAALTALGTLATGATLTRPGAVSLSATGTLTALAVREVLAAAALSAMGTLAAQGAILLLGAVPLTAFATLAALAAVVVSRLTTRPYTGTTARPLAGTTARPFTGTTSRP